ncbi:MAG: hypothetical protein ACTHMS_17100 [Jatrophihabitans sp.]|uniref:hypothetical protein n=1 Tax=Jatrophihabitans sp. TaxID=1932789 RepID=UPI003F7FF0DB
MKSQLNAYLSAGMRVTLGLGIHYTPSWVFGLPNSSYVDEHGSVVQSPNLVFNQQVRNRVAGYLARINSDLGLGNFWAVRVNTTAEMLYPGNGSYFAFDANAQNGPDLPASQARNPFPGWHPGTTGLTSAQVDQWARWYVGALSNTADWLMTTMQGLGFPGWFQILTPGSGIRPDGWKRAIAANLPDGLIGVGAAWDVFYGALTQRTHVVVYVSSVADGSGGNDSCQSADTSVSLTDPAADSWSATRWLTRIARASGMQVAGENPGYSSASAAYYTDLSSAGLMATSLRQAVSCGFQVLYWAHDDRLWDGTVPFDSYATQGAAAIGSTPGLPALAG